MARKQDPAQPAPHVESNSASRLLRVLDRFEAGKPYAAQAVRAVFDVATEINKPPPVRQMYAAIDHIRALHDEFIRDLRDSSLDTGHKGVLLSGVESIHEMVCPINPQAASRVLNGAERALLEMCASLMEKEPPLTADDIELIQQSIRELQELVKNADLPKSLRTILLELIRLSRDAIDRHQIYGVRGLSGAFKSMLGEVWDTYNRASPEEQREMKQSSAWPVVMKHLERFDGVVARMMKYKPLLEYGATMLIGGP